jgi:leucyl aminopeptidase (aminopeptidase T)
LAIEQERHAIVVRRAAGHLLEYLIRGGVPRVTVVHEPAYAPHVRALLGAHAAKPSVVDIEAIDVSQVALPEVLRVLGEAPALLLAFNRAYGSTPPVSVQAMIDRARADRFEPLWTLCDLDWTTFLKVFGVPPGELVDRAERVANRIRAAKVLDVRMPAGAVLRIPLNSDYDVVRIDGFQEAAGGLTVNLPAGEVATYPDPQRISGTILFTGGLLGTIPIGRKHGLVQRPIQLDLVRGRVTDVKGDNVALVRDVRYCLGLEAHGAAISEIGFGTHPAIRSLCGLNYSYEEKHLGFHLGFGASLTQQNVTRQSNHHLDLLFDDVRLYLDDQLFFDGNDFVD